MTEHEDVRKIELTGKQIPLGDEDRHQMHKLSKEIKVRLLKMSKIMRRVGAIDTELPVRWVIEEQQTNTVDSLQSPIVAAGGGGHTITQVCSEVGNCGCYEDPPGICYVGCFSGG